MSQPPAKDQSLDILGIKGLGDSIRLATEAFIEGASALLGRICLPAAQELGLALRDRVSAWRARNATRMLHDAYGLLPPGLDPEERVPPRLASIAIEESSWIEDDDVRSMWAGLLVSSMSVGGLSDENLLFMTLLKQLSSLQVRLLTYAIGQARKLSIGGLPFARGPKFPVSELATLFAGVDIHRLDRELDHLREIGLIGSGITGGISPSAQEADLTPTPLALHLYVRAQGARVSPVEYWHLTPPAHEPPEPTQTA